MIVYPLENYNSWASIEEADTYFAERLNAESWDGLDDTAKTKLLVRAFEVISLLGAENPPVEILKKAQLEQAIHEYRHNPELAATGLAQVQIGHMKVDWSSAPNAKMLSDTVIALLRPYRRWRTIACRR